ncbi:MAG: iron ABC transporter permease [Nitrospirota bacterium]|jgi:iron complex transport system permease protein
MSRIVFWIAAVLTLLLAVLSGALVGAVPVSVADVASLLGGEAGDPVAATILREVRLPRVARAALVGGMLSMAGAVFQVLLRNPLADPYILGVSGGAAVGAIAVVMIGAGAGWTMAGGSLAGALFTVAVVFLLAGAWRGAGGDRLLLTGVVLASFWGALVALFLSVSQNEQLRSVLFWLMGDLGQTGALAGTASAFAVGLAGATALGRSMDALTYGDRHAMGLGVAVRPVRGGLYIAGSLMTAAAVSAAGTIGFVGLIVPHAVRLFGVRSHRELIPASAVVGAAFLVLADTAGRTIVSPIELPVGVVTAFIGAPFFLWLLRREKKS